MEIRPILSAMRRNKVGAILIALQMAITLAILCNALFIVQQRLALSQRPTGTDEANIFAMTNQWVGQAEDIPAQVQTDLATLRALPGVVDAYVTNSYPLRNGGWGGAANLHPDQKTPTAHVSNYFGDEHMIRTLGVQLLAGRNFSAADVHDRGNYDDPLVPGVIVTRTLADELFPGGNALGQSIYINADKTSTPIIGVIDMLQVPWTSFSGWGSTFSYNSVLQPFRYNSSYAYYVVRVQPGQLSAVMRSAPLKLFEVNRARVLTKVQSLAEARVEAYRDDRGLAAILGVVCAVLLAVTAFGIVGLTSYWVTQRRRQIGIRRALGATRTAIVRYFQTENFLIAAAGAATGVGLAVTLNLWMVSSFEMARLHLSYTVVGAVIVLLLGQGAVLWPAIRAASIPPVVATRGG
jgi:putative ABC transport system permease protein